MTMKKIKSIKQLQAEKERLHQRQLDLAKKINNNWKDLKESLKPVNVAKDIFNSVSKSKIEDECNNGSTLKNTFDYGFSLLAKKVTGKLARRFSNLSQK